MAAGVLAFGAVAAAGCSPGGVGKGEGPAMVVGVPEGAGTGTSGPKVITSAPEEEAPPQDPGLFVDPAPFGGGSAEPPPIPTLAAPNGKPWAAPIPFTTQQEVPDGLVFILVAGSDARPGEELTKTRADSLHLLCVNPETGQGTLLGFPRDSWVEIPGHGRGKINNALALGGPNLLAKTVRRLTGLPVDYYVLTGFKGLIAMVDELGGVDVHVDRRMNDKASGARFQRGWHHMTGGQALAYSRNRTDVEQGDLSRSEHQGELMLAALAKMRSEVADDGGVARWISVLVKHAKLDVPLNKLPQLGALARRLDPARIKNIVAPGRLGFASRQSVVFLTTEAARMFEDLRPDAVLGTAQPAPTSSSSSSSSTTAPGRSSQPPRSGPSSSTSSSSTATTGPESTTSTTEHSDTPVTLFPDE
ncbi:MAG TPA: LCP family protein [Acidimicrobiia bacterium]|nr:LCP family protein [Acidimicrobiia bacterium]